MATVAVGFEVRRESDDARRLLECAVRRFTGNSEATPDAQLGPVPITVQAESYAQAIANAEQCVTQCAGELGIAESWELVALLRPTLGFR